MARREFEEQADEERNQDKKESKESPQREIVEQEINLTLLNQKLNYIISLLQDKGK